MVRINVTAVQYPNVLADHMDPIPISSINGFKSAPCVIEADGGMYVVVTDNVPPPLTDDCVTGV